MFWNFVVICLAGIEAGKGKLVREHGQHARHRHREEACPAECRGRGQAGSKSGHPRGSSAEEAWFWKLVASGVRSLRNVALDAAGRKREAVNMPTGRLRALRYALVATGLICIFGVFPLTCVWPSAWRWDPDNGMSLQMILIIHATLGVFVLSAARAPERHLSLIWLTVWSCAAHGGVMAAQAVAYPVHRGHLVGDVPALLAIAIVLGVLTPRCAQLGERAPLSRAHSE